MPHDVRHPLGIDTRSLTSVFLHHFLRRLEPLFDTPPKPMMSCPASPLPKLRVGAVASHLYPWENETTLLKQVLQPPQKDPAYSVTKPGLCRKWPPIHRTTDHFSIVSRYRTDFPIFRSDEVMTPSA